MGQYDIPASIDYVLNETGQTRLASYFGYSLGCSVFFMSASHNPRLNDQVDMMIGIGPTVSVAHLNNYFRYMAPFVNLYQVSVTKVFSSLDRRPEVFIVFQSFTKNGPVEEKFTQTMDFCTLSLVFSAKQLSLDLNLENFGFHKFSAIPMSLIRFLFK